MVGLEKCLYYIIFIVYLFCRYCITNAACDAIARINSVTNGLNYSELHAVSGVYKICKIFAILSCLNIIIGFLYFHKFPCFVVRHTICCFLMNGIIYWITVYSTVAGVINSYFMRLIKWFLFITKNQKYFTVHINFFLLYL